MDKAFLEFPRPRLIVIGPEDRAYASALAVCDEDSAVTTVVLEGLTHGTALSRSELVVPHLQKFLASVKA